MTRQYTKFIPCPAHPSGRVHWWDLTRHSAILFCWPGKWAGIWECPRTGESDAHIHTDYEIDTGETAPTSPLDSGYEFEIYICGGELGCGVTIEDADPVFDRLEARADYAADEYSDRELENAV